MPYQPYLGPVVALIAGILILIQPGLLSIIVAVYLIVTGILGLMGARPTGWFGADNPFAAINKEPVLAMQGLGPGKGRN